MRSLKNLDSKKSIDFGRLIYNESIRDKIDIYTNYLIFLSFIYFSIFGLRSMKPSLNNDFDYCIYFFLITFGIYGAYCTFTEKRLKEIRFKIHQEEAMKRILEYGKRYHYRISKISNNLIILNEPMDYFGFGNYEKTTVIFFMEQSILFTVLNEGPKINTTVLISQHLAKRHLKKVLNSKNYYLKKKKGYFDGFFNDPS